MKTLLCTIILLAVNYGIMNAQNSVTIKQTGSNNSAVISQSAGIDMLTQNIIRNNPCYKTSTANQHKDKNFITLKAQNNSSKNSYTVTGRANNKLYLVQNGNKAQRIGFIKNIDSLSAIQHGAKNGIILYLNTDHAQKSDEKNSYNLTQKGDANAIYIAPCEKNKESSSSKNNIKVTQKGTGNSAHIFIDD